MISISRSLEVEFSAKQMFDLVGDYPSYPLFINACKRAEIVKQISENQVLAELELCFIGVCKSFSTRTTLINNKLITIKLENGPFQSLEGEWLFEDLPQGKSLITSNMTYSFKNLFLEKMIGSFFEEYSKNLINSFHKRAQELYTNEQ